ncbi:MAG: rhodanese-like domain-containing protein [Actinomycetota bacterium]
MTRRMWAALAVGAMLTLVLASCGGTDAQDDTSRGGAGWDRVSPAALQERMAAEDVYLVNVHVPYEGEIPGTDAFISYTEVADRLGELPDDGSLVIYCRSGNMSTQAAQEMVDAGFTGFVELEGGFQAWEAAGLPFEVNAA